MRLIPTVLAVSIAAAGAPALAQDDNVALRAELKRLAERVETLEKENREMRKQQPPEATPAQTANTAQPAKTAGVPVPEAVNKLVKAFEGVEFAGSITGVMQKADSSGTASGKRESRHNYRGDLTLSLPIAPSEDSEGKLFTHFRFGQGTGVGLRPTYTSTANTVAFEVGDVPDDSFGILAQAWYQLKLPLFRDSANKSSDSLYLTVGKIDPFVFFDQNGIADDESSRFMNNVFVHNPLLDSGGDIGADKYGFTPGFIAKYENSRREGAEWGVSLGAFGSGPGANFSGSLSDPFVIGQVETAATINNLPGNYRAYFWTNGRSEGYDGVVRRHSGLGASIDQKLTEDLTLFSRLGYHGSGKVRFDRALTLGAELAGKGWGRPDDALGLALGRLRTSSDYRRDSADIDGYRAAGYEDQAELFYRYKFNEAVELTPDFQWIRRPGGDGSADDIKVWGLRAKIGF
ncbi:MAG: carbohydrate porin [Rhodocyclaceae bacterium]